jgi:hypothetical protein
VTYRVTECSLITIDKGKSYFYLQSKRQDLIIPP